MTAESAKNIGFDPARWTRYELEGTPIYLRGDRPDWFVPNRAGEALLSGGMSKLDDAGSRFLQRLPRAGEFAYPGRASVLELDQLKEVWLHITDRCNQACRHCLFSCSPTTTRELFAERILELAGQACELGCRVFTLTGGEPFVHGEIERIIDGLLSLSDVHVAILTNGLELRRFEPALARWNMDRLHLQISLDGLQEGHDAIRGKGAFARLTGELEWLKSRGVPYTLSMCVNRRNLDSMPAVCTFAGSMGARGMHFLWYFVRGRGDDSGFADPEHIFERLVESAAAAEEAGIGIDNLEALRSQVFAPPGTIHDGGVSGWESVAVGPDGKLYPSAALVGMDELGTEIDGDLGRAWRESKVLEDLRHSSAASLTSPWRFILGGGDPDHSFVHGGSFTGRDPYLPLYEKTALWLIAREASRQADDGPPGLRLKMGEVLEGCGAHGPIGLVHSNCLLSVAQNDSRSVVKSFYSRAASSPRLDIVNPVSYPEELITHIPKEFRFRGYGCGSPVLDAGIQEGDRVVDLGSGTGVECFIAARQAGRAGSVTGVDMLDPMLEQSRRGAQGVAGQLGYANLEFKPGYLEDLPLKNDSADVVISNCVVNLSSHKRKTFSEALRVLRPGGRLVIADVVCESEPDASIRNDDTLRGECIAGALTRTDLLALLAETGFCKIQVLRQFPYREVQGHPFFSLTYQAYKPGAEEKKSPVFVDSQSVDLSPGSQCCCAPAADSKPRRHRSGCMTCGKDLKYLPAEVETDCVFCNRTHRTRTLCVDDHFVCDACHSVEGLADIERICLETRETDMLALLEQIRRLTTIPLHGPEHHAMVPGIILSTYQNLGGLLPDGAVQTGIRRGAQVPGGQCGFAGVCGAATGVGIAFGLILESNPLKGKERSQLQLVVQLVLGEIGKFEAARCCQRDSWIALVQATELSKRLLPIGLQAEHGLTCKQHQANQECPGESCPLYPVSS